MKILRWIIFIILIVVILYLFRENLFKILPFLSLFLLKKKLDDKIYNKSEIVVKTEINSVKIDVKDDSLKKLEELDKSLTDISKKEKEALDILNNYLK